MPKVLTQAQVDQFWNEGYCAPFDCLTPAEAAQARAKHEAYEASVDGPIEIAYRPVINEYRGFRKVEIHLVDWRPARSMAAV